MCPSSQRCPRSLLDGGRSRSYSSYDHRHYPIAPGLVSLEASIAILVETPSKLFFPTVPFHGCGWHVETAACHFDTDGDQACTYLGACCRNKHLSLSHGRNSLTILDGKVSIHPETSRPSCDEGADPWSHIQATNAWNPSSHSIILARFALASCQAYVFSSRKAVRTLVPNPWSIIIKC